MLGQNALSQFANHAVDTLTEKKSSKVCPFVPNCEADANSKGGWNINHLKFLAIGVLPIWMVYLDFCLH